MRLSETLNTIKNIFLVNLIILLVVKFDFSLTSSIVIFTFTSLGSKDFYIKSISMISYISVGKVYPIVDVGVFFRSNISTVSSYGSWYLYTIPSI